MELYNFILSEGLTACQVEVSEGPRQAELSTGYQPAGSWEAESCNVPQLQHAGSCCNLPGTRRKQPWHGSRGNFMTQFHGTKSYLDILVEDPLPGYCLKTYILSKGMLNCSSLDTGYGTLGTNKRQLLKSGLNTLSSGGWWLQSQNRFASLHFYFFLTFPFG